MTDPRFFPGQVEPNRAVHPRSQPGPTPDDDDGSPPWRTRIDWRGFGYLWEIDPDRRPLRAIGMDDTGTARVVATGRTRPGLILAMWRKRRKGSR